MKLSDYAQLKIGEGLISDHVMSTRQVEVVLLNQRMGDPRKFGEIAVYMNFLQSRDLDKYLYLKHFAVDSVSPEDAPVLQYQ